MVRCACFFALFASLGRSERGSKEVWSERHHPATLPADKSRGSALVLCVLHEDGAEAKDLLDRLAKAGLGDLPKVMIDVERQLATMIP